MDATLRAALMLVRLVAACIMVVGLLDTGLYVTRCYEPGSTVPVRVLPIVLNSIPFVIGIGVWIRAKAIARWVADKFE